MDKIDKIVVGILVAAATPVIAILFIALYIVAKAVFGA